MMNQPTEDIRIGSRSGVNSRSLIVRPMSGSPCDSHSMSANRAPEERNSRDRDMVVGPTGTWETKDTLGARRRWKRYDKKMAKEAEQRRWGRPDPVLRNLKIAVAVLGVAIVTWGAADIIVLTKDTKEVKTNTPAKVAPKAPGAGRSGANLSNGRAGQAKAPTQGLGG
jgi:hypothetical protein